VHALLAAHEPVAHGDTGHHVNVQFTSHDKAAYLRLTRKSVQILLVLGTSALIASVCTRAPSPPQDSWTVRVDGMGVVQVGMTIVEVERLVGGAARIERIEPDEACGYAYSAALPAGTSLMLSGDTVVRVNVDTKGIRTEAGVEVGGTEAGTLERYLGIVRVEPHPYTGPEGHYLIVDDPAHPQFRLIFETDGKVVTSFRAGRRSEVDLIEGCL